MPKKALEQNVYDACVERTKYVLDNFEKVYISFSGGKDSTVMLHILMDEAIKRKKRVGVLFIDLEGQYKMTIDHIKKCYDMYKEYIDPYWICLPIHLRNAVSVYSPFWVCWEKDKEKAWIREMPKGAISDTKFFPFFREGMEFEEFVPEFGEWYSKGESCACLVGIRSDESLNRFRTIASETKIKFKDKQWTTKVTDHTYNIYPIYDWRTKDDWVYHYKFPDKPYNRLYDIMHKAGCRQEYDNC